MFLHLGSLTVVRTETILGIFDLDTTTVQKSTREYLARAQKEGNVVNVSSELPKSFVICKDETGEELVYLSQLSVSTLLKRLDGGTSFGYR